MGKIRLYELAKDIGVSSKVLLEGMQQLGMPVKSYMSTLEDEEIRQLKEAIVKNETPSLLAPKTSTEKVVKNASLVQTKGAGDRDPGPAKTKQTSGQARANPAPEPVRTTEKSGTTPAQTVGDTQSPGPARPTRTPCTLTRFSRSLRSVRDQAASRASHCISIGGTAPTPKWGTMTRCNS